VGKVTCTALLEWTPDPETITCKVGCNKVRNAKNIYLTFLEWFRLLLNDI